MELKMTARDMVAGAYHLIDKHSKWVILWCLLGILAEIAIMPYEGFATARDFLLFFPALAVEMALYYYLSKRFLIAAGYKADHSDLLAYLGIGLLLGLIVGLGFLFLILPGVILWARFCLWAPILLTEERPALDVAGESWQRTSGHTSAIILAHLLPLVILTPVWFISGLFPESQGSFRLALAVLTSATGAYWFCLSVAIYSRLSANRAPENPAPA